MKLLLGLGNIGSQYAHTRHNAGFMVLDQFARDHSLTWRTDTKFKAAVTETDYAGQRLILAKPTTMMNLSGEAAQRLMQFYKLQPHDVWVIFDDVDTPFGRLRIRQGGSSSGHQGLKSLIRHIGSDFGRLKFGISLNDRAIEPSEVYVLKPFKPEEQTQLPQVLASATRTLEQLLESDQPTESTHNLIS